MSDPISFDSSTPAAPIRNLVIAGWTGRNEAALRKHIDELAAMGVAPPKSTPVFYRVGASLLTTAPAVEVIGKDSTGEVEFVLFNLDGEIRVGLGSDHTDRKAEVVGVTLAKQMCPKPIARETWALADVEPHWDQLLLRSWAVSGGNRTLYQQGKVSAMRPPRDLMALYGQFAPGTAMFCGTFGVEGGIRWADTFIMELEDPLLGRSITHRYDIIALPIEG
jgi:hypothetical protein